MNVLNALRRNSKGVPEISSAPFCIMETREWQKKRAIEEFCQSLETATGTDKLGLPFLSFPLIVIIVI